MSSHCDKESVLTENQAKLLSRGEAKKACEDRITKAKDSACMQSGDPLR